MGNTPTKEERPRSSSLSHVGQGQSAPGARSSRRHTTSSSSGVTSKHVGKPEDKLHAKEKHARDLIVRFRENVDGGYLAPHGTYKSNLDFHTQIVRGLILKRRIAPFFTPLQDFDESWTEDEIVTLVRQSPLHALDSAYSEEEDVDDMDDHKIHKSQNHLRRQEQKKRLVEMLARVKDEQRLSEIEYFEARTKSGEERDGDADLASRDLIAKLYGVAAECPICFLYFPNPLNFSRCCQQPICTECFVQIKRLDPHHPHDEASQTDNHELPHTLISEPANCPFCAMSNFGVTYEPPMDVNVGLGSPIKPSEYSKEAASDIGQEDNTNAVEFVDGSENLLKLPVNKSNKVRRRSSVAADSELVITTDFIRPGWEQRLASAKSRLARKAAAASAIHASNLMINDEAASSRGTQDQNSGYLLSLEDRMMAEAMKLSLLEEEERVARVEREKKKEDKK